MSNFTKILLIAACFLGGAYSLTSQTYRYVNTVFPSSVKTADIIYDSAPALTGLFLNESATEIEDLIMDIYTPAGDTNMDRPVIIFAHSGGFINGDRNHDDMVAFCDSFARKGYVTATIDYRKGFNFIGNTSMHATRAVYRGLQDGRSAVRFMRANAATYGINPDKIYLAGSSAGGFIALHSIYMDEPSEKPTDAGPVSYFSFPFFRSGPDLGGYDVGNNLAFDGEPNGIISLWGALEGIELITPSNNEPAFLVHGSSDGTVPFNSGPPFGVGLLPDVDGSNLINNQLDALGLTDKETYFLTGEDHEFHGTSNGDWDNGFGGNAFWDAIVEQSTDFLYQIHKPTADFVSSSGGLMVDYFDASSNATAWSWEFGDGNTSTDQNPMHTYAAEGDYEVFLYIEDQCASWDTISYMVSVVAPLPVVWSSPISARYDEKYNEAILHWSVAQQTNNENFIVEHSLDGREFSTIEIIKGDGNLVEEKAFSAVHKNPSSGTNYYRIKQVDFDGIFEYSEIVSIEVETQNKPIAIYPNPTTGRITIDFLSSEPAPTEIYNSIGMLVKSIPTPTSEIFLEILDLETGLYFVKVEGVKEVQRLMVKR